MSANQKRKLFCVWDNKGDVIIAIDQPAEICASLMGIERDTFYVFKARMKSHPESKRRWTIIPSIEIKEEEP